MCPRGAPHPANSSPVRGGVAAITQRQSSDAMSAVGDDCNVGEAVLHVLVENRKVVLSVFEKYLGRPHWPEDWPAWPLEWERAFPDFWEERQTQLALVPEMQTRKAEAKLLSLLAAVSSSVKAFVDQRLPPTARADAAQKLKAAHERAWEVYETTDAFVAWMRMRGESLR